MKDSTPTAAEFAAAREHLPPGLSADGYLRTTDGTLLPLVRERYYAGGVGYDTLYSPWLFGADTMRGVTPREFGRMMAEGRAWHASAADVAEALDVEHIEATLSEVLDREPIPGRTRVLTPQHALGRRMAMMGMGRDESLRLCEAVTGRAPGSLASRNDLSRAEVERVNARLDAMDSPSMERGVPA